MYCSACGGEVPSESAFCSHCGEELDVGEKNTDDESVKSESQVNTTDPGSNSTEIPDKIPSEDSPFDRLNPTNWKVGISALMMALVVGIAGYVALFTVWESGWLFFIIFFAVYFHLANQDYPSEAAGVGFYITALFVLIFPVIFYFDIILAAEGEPGSEWIAVGGIIALVIWGFIGIVVASVLAGIGYLFNRRAKKLAVNEPGV